MKIRGIVFSGFMSVILMSAVGMDASAVNLASKSYVDNALAQKQNTLTAGEGIDITDNVVKSTIDTSKFAMKDEIPGLSAFATDEELAQLKTTLEAAIAEKQEKGDYASAADLKSLQDAVNSLQSGGVDKTLVENLKTTVETISADYAKKTELTAVEGKLQAAIDAIVVPSLEGYAKLTDIPSLDGYAKTADVAATYATKESLTDYAKASDLANKAETSMVNTLQQSVTNIENTYLTQEAAQNTYVTESKVTEQITQVVGTDTSGLKKQVADNTAALAGKANVSDVYSKTDADSKFLIVQDANVLGANLQWDENGKLNTKGIATADGLEELEDKVADAVTESELAAKGYQTSSDVQGAITTATADLATKSELNTALTGYTKTADLAAVATSGSYADLDDKPTIPSIDGLATSKQLEDLQSTLEAEIAKKQNSGQYLVAADLTTLNNAVSALQSGKADASTVTALQETVSKLGETYATDSELSSAIDGVEALIAAIKVPTKTSDLENDSGYITENELSDYAKSADVYSKTDADSKFLIMRDANALGANLQWDEDGKLNTKGIVTAEGLEDLENKVASAVTETELDAKGYLTASSIATGADNGTIAVGGTDIPVKGLGSAAYTETSAYVTGPAPVMGTNFLQATCTNKKCTYTFISYDDVIDQIKSDAGIGGI